jgi:hypothetical protein
MTIPAPPPPEPADPGRATNLSARERDVLARIEAGLAEADPVLARELATRRPPVLGVRAPMTRHQFGALLAIVLVLAAAAAGLPDSLWWPVLPLLTVGLVVPWMAYCHRHPVD